MASRCAEKQETWIITERARQRHITEDAEADLLLNRYRAICDRRAGRLINEHFWCWCAGCGAERVLCMEYERALVDGRAAGLCARCRPGPDDYEALRLWQALSAAERREMNYRAFSIGHFGKSIPEPAVRAAASFHVPAARKAAQKAAGDGLYLSAEHQAVLRLGGAADLRLLDAALARIARKDAA